jgi:predicted RNA polymerase sigma factor
MKDFLFRGGSIARLGDLDRATECLERAIALTTSPADRQFLRAKCDAHRGH